MGVKRKEKVRMERCKLVEERASRHLQKFLRDAPEYEREVEKITKNRKGLCRQTEVLLDAYLSYLRYGGFNKRNEDSSADK